MKTKKDFTALLEESLTEMLAVERGEMQPARKTLLTVTINAIQTRQQLGISQPKFAKMIGVSVRTLENWEQGRSQPNGAAKALLRVAAYAPDVVLKALSGSS
jgi:putative transcriptional regulator